MDLILDKVIPAEALDEVIPAEALRDPAVLRAVLANPRLRQPALEAINRIVLDSSYVFKSRAPLHDYIQAKVPAMKNVYTLREVTLSINCDFHL